jgi:hypothetical protein
MTRHQPRTPEGLLQLERTGPFVPPITLASASAGDLLVTGAFRAELARSPLTGLEFRPAEKTHIVRLEWERWDLTAEDPPAYPQGGEPESYILDRQHDPGLAAQIGPIWETVLPASTNNPALTWYAASPPRGASTPVNVQGTGWSSTLAAGSPSPTSPRHSRRPQPRPAPGKPRKWRTWASYMNTTSSTWLMSVLS